MTDPTPRPPSSPDGHTRLLALLDYDGTVTTQECNEVVLQNLVGDAWRHFEDEVRDGRMSHGECLRRQVALVRAPRTEFLGALVEAARPAPGLAAFFAALAERGGRGAIVSAGFREAIQAFWRRENLLALDIFAGELVAAGQDGQPPFDIAFNAAFGDCPRCGPAQCKAAVLRALRRPGDVVLVFGDGAGDLCMARQADLTFARGFLAERCEAEGLEWRPLPDYEAIWNEVDNWLEQRSAQRSDLEPPGLAGF